MTDGIELRDYKDSNAQGHGLLPDDNLRHAHAQGFHHKMYTAVLREREGMDTHNLSPSRERSVPTTAL